MIHTLAILFEDKFSFVVFILVFPSSSVFTSLSYK